MSLRPRKVRTGSESGMSSIEVVLLTPLVFGFLMVLVCFGVLVDARGNIEGAAADAARAGSLQDNSADAKSDARSVVTADLGSSRSDSTCTGGWSLTYSSGFAPGDDYVVDISCVVSLKGLDWFSLGKQTISIKAASPIDTYRTTNS
jgi:Flp pilus assembly protein TadG